jgi:hypothetical protein
LDLGTQVTDARRCLSCAILHKPLGMTVQTL